MPQRRHILLIEDNHADVVMIRKAVSTAEVDAEVHVVYDGQAATEFFDAADSDENAPRPDLVLLDMNLPKKSGAEVLRHLRVSTRSRNATVLIVSSSDAPRDQRAVASLGVAGYFKKPFDYVEYRKLGPLVKQLLESQRSGSAHQ